MPAAEPPSEPTSSAPGEKPSATSSTAWTVGNQFLAAAFAFISSIIAFRVLGPADRGEVVFLTVMANLTTAASMMGVEVAHGNILGQEPEKAKTIVTNSFVLAAVLGGIAALIVIVLFSVFPVIKRNTSWSLVLLALAVIPVMVLQIYLRWLAVTEYRFALANWTTTIVPGTNLIVNATLAIVGALTVTGAVISWIAAQTLAMIVLAIWAVRDIGMTKPDGSLMKRSLIFGAKNHLTTTMQLANFRIDQLFVGSIAGNAQLGIYANAVAFSETMFYLPQAIAQVLRPDLIRSKNEDAAKLAAQGLRISFIILGVVGGAIIVLAPYLLEFAFGKEALEGTLMLRILIVGALGIAATKLCSTALSSRNYPFASAIPIGISMVLTVVLDILLIPELGGKGAAIASTSAYLLAGFSVMFVFARTFKVPMSLMIPRASDVRLILEPLKDLRSRLRSRGDRS